MENTRTPHNHGEELVLETLVQILQAPVPIVVVVIAEELCARFELMP